MAFRSHERESNQGRTHEVEVPALYSAFSRNTKMFIVGVCCFISTFFGFSTYIFYPAVEPLTQALHTTKSLINLTNVPFQVVAGLAPAIVGCTADFYGRRPVYNVSLILFTASNIGLALLTSYPALLGRRMLQIVGASGTIALAYGVIADVIRPADRGQITGLLNACTNAAPSLGAIIGGLLIQRFGWTSIFWFLAILSGLCQTVMFLFFLETARNIVGNGSESKTSVVVCRLPGSCSISTRQNFETSQHKWNFPNPFACLFLLRYRNTLFTILLGSFSYTTFSCLGDSISISLASTYELDALQAGLVYIPLGAGGVLVALTIGKLLDWDWIRTARETGYQTTGLTDSDLSTFPVEYARLRSVWYLVAIDFVATIGYGWALQVKTNLAIPLLLQFFTGGSSVGIFTMVSSLIIDLNPTRSATAQAAYNLVSCIMAGSVLAALPAMLNRLGAGWCFTLCAGFYVAAVPLVWYLQNHGLKRRGLAVFGKDWDWATTTGDEGDGGEGNREVEVEVEMVGV